VSVFGAPPPGFVWEDELAAGPGAAAPARRAGPAPPPGFVWEEELAAPPPRESVAPPPAAGPAPAGMAPPPGGTAPRAGSLAPEVMQPENPLRQALLAKRLAGGGAPLGRLGPEAVQAAGAAAAPPMPDVPLPGLAPVLDPLKAFGMEAARATPGALSSLARFLPDMQRNLMQGAQQMAGDALNATPQERRAAQIATEAIVGAAGMILPALAPAAFASQGDVLEEKVARPLEALLAGTDTSKKLDEKRKTLSTGEKLRDPEMWGATIGAAVPSLGVMAATRALGAPILPATVALEGGATLRDIERFEEETGEKVHPLRKFATAGIVGLVNGTLEKVGFERGVLRLSALLPKPARKGFVRAATQAVQGGIGEGGTEMSQEAVSNVVTGLLVDPTREWNEGLTEAGMGGFGAGFFLGGGAGAKRSSDVQERAQRMKAREQWKGEEAPWTLEDEDGGAPVSPERAEKVARWQERNMAPPPGPASPDEDLERFRAGSAGLDAQLRSLKSEEGQDTAEGIPPQPYEWRRDEDLTRLEAEASELERRIEALRRGEVPPPPAPPERALSPQPPHRPISVDTLLGAQALPGVVGETRFRDQTAEARGRNVRRAMENEERQRIANTPGEALRLILGDEPAFRPAPAPAVERAPPGTPVARQNERRVGPVPVLDWIDAKSQEVDEDRRDLSPEEWTPDEARYFALTDQGTGLANRQAYAIAQKQTPAAVHAVLDVDGLKKINDTFGHEAGDEYLSTVALVARQKGLRLFRVGGDEFTALYDGDEQTIRDLLESVRSGVESTRVPVEGKQEGEYPLHEGFSYGIGPDFATADARAYEDKRGRKARRAAGANPAVQPQPVGVGRGAGAEAPAGPGNPARVPPPVRKPGDGTGGSGAPPAGPASLPPPVTPPAPAAAAPRTAAPNPAPTTSSFPRSGKEGEAFTADGERVGVRWAVADVFEDVVPSHTVTLEENPAFAQVLQPRDRGRFASEQQVEGMARAIRPAALGESYDAGNGAPIVGPDRLVESGNGRTIALQRAYRMGKGDEYRRWLEEHAAEFGLTPEQVREVKTPVLVRVRTTPTEDRAELVRKFNVPTVARMSAAETARADAERLTPALLERFQPGDDGLAILAVRNRPFVAAFLEAMPENERSELLDEDGQLNQAGRKRIENALLGLAYGRSPVLERIAESTDDNTRLVSAALLNSAPAMATVRSAIESGKIHAELDPAPAIVEAVQKLAWLRDEGGTVESYLQQTGLFGDEMTPGGRAVLGTFGAFKRSGRKLTTFLTNLSEGLILEGDAQQESLFGDAQIPPLEDFVRAARRFTADAGQASLDLGGEDLPGPRPKGPDPEGSRPGGSAGPVDRPRVSRAQSSPAPGAPRDVLLVHRYVQRLTGRWKDAPQITVVSTVQELPEWLRDEIGVRAEGVGTAGGVKGIYTGATDDQVFLVASALRSDADVQEVVLHEVMGHAGLRRLLGREQFGTVMDQIADSLPDEVDAKARAYGLDLTDQEQRREAADEVLAEWAGRDEAPPGAITRAIGAIRGMLRKVFPSLKWSHDDVRVLLAKARSRVEGGRGAGARGGAEARFARFSREPDGSGTVSFGDVELPLNDDGTVYLYHHTSEAAAEKIRASASLRSSGEPDVYVTTEKEPVTGYGDVSVRVKVDPRALVLEDVFPGGRADFRMSVRRPGGTKSVRFSRAGDSRKRVQITDLEGQEFTTGGRGMFLRARSWARENLLGRSFLNADTGMTVTVGRNAIDKILSASAQEQSATPWHVEAMKVVPELIQRGVRVAERADSRNVQGLKTIHRFLAPLRTPDGTFRVKLTVKEYETGPNGLYTYELAEVSLPGGTNGITAGPTANPPLTGQDGDRGAVADMSLTDLLGEEGAGDIRFSRTTRGSGSSPAEDRIYDALTDRAREVRLARKSARERAEEVWDELLDPGDILEARASEELPPHSAEIQQQLRPAAGVNRVRAMLNPAENAYQKAVRYHYSIEKFGKRLGTHMGPAHKDPGVVAELAAGHAARAEQFIAGGGGFGLGADGNIEWTGNRSLKDILSDLGPGRLNELRRYLIARRVIELHGREDSILAGISEASARQEVDGAPEDTKRAAEEITALLDDALRYWAAAGGLSPEAVEAIRNLNRAYVPFYRVFEGHDPVVGGATASGGRLVLPPERGAALQSEQAVKTIMGSSRPILDPLVSAVDHIQRMIRAADRNRVGTTLVEAAEARPDDAVGMIEEVTRPGRTGEAVTKEGLAVQEFADSLGIEVSNEAAAAVSLLSDKELIGTNDRIKVYRDGTLHEYRVAPEIGDSLRAMGPETADLFKTAIALPARILRGGVTKNPLFQIHNLQRDTGDAGVQSRNGFVPILSSIQGIKLAIADGSLRREFLAAGGGYATLSGGGLKGAEATLKAMAPKTRKGTVVYTVRHPLEALARFGRPFEEAARLAEYKKAREHGKSATEAALDAARVTTNFTVHGSSPFFRWLTLASAFVNPAIQGTDKFFRTVLEAPRGEKQSARRIARAAGAVAFRGVLNVGMVSAILYALNYDDDEIEEKRKTKAGAVWWFVRVPGTKIILRFPKPFAWGQVFGTGMETFLDKARGEDPDAMKRWRDEVYGMLFEGLVPFPTIAKVPVELILNRSFFFKRPIVPRYAEGLEPDLQSAPRTGETVRLIGEKLNFSPAKIEHAVGGVGGTLAREAMKVSDMVLRDSDVSPPAKRLSDLPIVGRGFSSPDSSGYSTEKFYRELDELRRVQKSYKQYLKQDPAKAREYARKNFEHLDAAKLKRYEKVARSISGLRKVAEQVRKMADSAMTPRQKSDRIAAIEGRMTALAAAAIGKPKKEPSR